jgi:hypothetical protein
LETVAPNTDIAVLLAELDDRVRRAWSAYKDHLADLDGPAYAAAEPEVWATLESALADIAADRAELQTTQHP